MAVLPDQPFTLADAAKAGYFERATYPPVQRPAYLDDLASLANARRAQLAELRIDLEVARLERGLIVNELARFLEHVIVEHGDNVQLLVDPRTHAELLRDVLELMPVAGIIHAPGGNQVLQFMGVPVHRDRSLTDPSDPHGRVIAAPLKPDPFSASINQAVSQMHAAARQKQELERRAREHEERARELEVRAAAAQAKLDAEAAFDARYNAWFDRATLHLEAAIGTAAAVGAIAVVLYWLGAFSA